MDLIWDLLTNLSSSRLNQEQIVDSLRNIQSPWYSKKNYFYKISKLILLIYGNKRKIEHEEVVEEDNVEEIDDLEVDLGPKGYLF